MTSALISPQELHHLLNCRAENLAVLDASYGMGVSGLNPETVFAQMRIGPAQYFDIDVIADHNNPLPHMLPDAEEFAGAVGKLGISNQHLVVVYDQTGITMAASRAWWMFRVFGHSNIRVLDGGVPAWHAAGLPFISGKSATPVAQSFSSSFRPELVTSYEGMRRNIEDESAIILDARPPERYAGLAPEPRPGLQAGHMPGARSVPAGSLINPATRGPTECDRHTGAL